MLIENGMSGLLDSQDKMKKKLEELRYEDEGDDEEDEEDDDEDEDEEEDEEEEDEKLIIDDENNAANSQRYANNTSSNDTDSEIANSLAGCNSRRKQNKPIRYVCILYNTGIVQNWRRKN